MKNKFLLPAMLALLTITGMKVNAQTKDFAQKSHLGISVGMMNYSGFMNKTAFTFKESHPSVEVMYRYDVTRNFNVRATFMTGSLSKDNGEMGTGETSGVNRAGKFKTSIFEASILPEYNFLDLTQHKVSPYIFVGGGYYTLINYQREGADYDKPDKSGINFRGGLGVKYLVNPSVQLFLEGSRREFSKSIDFYESKNSPSRYYSIMVGATFRLAKVKLNELW